MEFKFVLLLLASFAFTMVYTATSAEEKEVDDLVDALQAESTNWDGLPETSVLPYDAARQNVYGSVGFHKPASTFSINTGGIIAGQTEFLRLLEACLKLKAKVFSNLYVLYNNNYELIRGVANFLITKVPQIHAFALAAIHVLRTVLQFAIHAFSQWSIALPSINLEASHESYVQPQVSHNSYVQPHETYGVPSLNVASFLEHVNRK